jgi:hypothetical protein
LSSIPKLRVLDLSVGRFQNLPEELSDLKHVVCLELFNCGNLEELPEAVGKLHVLKRLILADCPKLKYLPSGVAGLTSLQVLDTFGCYNLRWAEHTCMKMTPSGIARTESLGHEDPAIRASVDDICGLVALTKLFIFGDLDSGVELPHKISALTKLKVLGLGLMNVKTLPAEMPDVFIQLQQLHLCFCKRLEYLPRSFTRPGAFPALIEFELQRCRWLVEFPEVDEGALPKLQTLDLSYCLSLGSLPLSLDKS